VNGWVLAFIVVGSLAAVALRPWRLWWGRRHCPQCNALLRRWDVWGWKEDWTCDNCGHQSVE
jgi:hypothetical protein